MLDKQDEEKECRVHDCEEPAEPSLDYCLPHQERFELIKKLAKKYWPEGVEDDGNNG